MVKQLGKRRRTSPGAAAATTGNAKITGAEARPGVRGRGAARVWSFPTDARDKTLKRRRDEQESMKAGEIPPEATLRSMDRKDVATLARRYGLDGEGLRGDAMINALSELRKTLPHQGANRDKIIKEDRDTLYLTLKAEPFEVMLTGEKDEEFRDPSDWIQTRLLHPDGSAKIYQWVTFQNGYETYVPKFTAQYLGFRRQKGVNKTYSNGLHVKSSKNLYVIKIGKVMRRENMELWNLRSPAKPSGKKSAMSGRKSPAKRIFSGRKQ